MSIPIKNIYFLLLYAWNVLEETDPVDLQGEEPNSLVDLFASVLNRGLVRQLKRGLDRQYVAHRDRVPGIRGKIDMSASLKSFAFQRASAVCEFDELSHDVHHNRIVKTTIARLIRMDGLDEDLRRDLTFLHRRMSDVREIRLTRSSFRSVQMHGNIRSYRLLLEVCRILHRHVSVDEVTGQTHFSDFTKDVHAMRRLFERFVFRFYKREQRKYRVHRDRLSWHGITGSESDLRKMPLLNTDVSLTSKSRKLIIETKFVENPFQLHHRKQSFRSGHLYQLFAYLRNIAVREQIKGSDRKIDGLLLYPQANASLDAAFSLHGHNVRVATVDLSMSADEIRKRLHSLI